MLRGTWQGRSKVSYPYRDEVLQVSRAYSYKANVLRAKIGNIVIQKQSQQVVLSLENLNVCLGTFICVIVLVAICVI